MGLKQQLLALRPKLAEVAQSVVDSWQQDEDGWDEDFGSGGVCDRVAEEMSSIIGNALPDVRITDGGQDGDDHAFIIVYDESEAYAVDVPPSVYETGGGYSWKKRQDAEVTPDDVVVWKVDRELMPDWDEGGEGL